MIQFCVGMILKNQRPLIIDNEALKMHKRIVKKARCIVTREINASLAGDRSNTNEQQKIVRDAKKLVRQLESSEIDNLHINAIKSVTDDGSMMLPSSDDTVSSDTVLDRIRMYHDIDDMQCHGNLRMSFKLG